MLATITCGAGAVRIENVPDASDPQVDGGAAVATISTA
jgi:hypothetical protein